MPGLDYQAIAQMIHESLKASGAEISSISEDELRVLVNAVAKAIAAARDENAAKIAENRRSINGIVKTMEDIAGEMRRLDLSSRLTGR